MQLAVQYSPEATDLLHAGDITFDLFKCPDWHDLVATAQTHHPVYVHFPLMAGRGTAGIDWHKIETFLETTETRFVNMHLAPHAGDFPGMPLETTDPDWTDRIVARMIADVEVVQARFGAERVILENVPYDPSPKYAIPRPALEAAVVNRVVGATGCGLLLDTAHARIAALHLGIDPITYLDQLPGEHMRELHVTGIVYNDDQQRWNDHFALSAEDWRLAEHTFAHIASGKWAAPAVVAFEYGGVGDKFAWRSEKRVLAHDLPRLHALIRRTVTVQTE